MSADHASAGQQEVRAPAPRSLVRHERFCREIGHTKTRCVRWPLGASAQHRQLLSAYGSDHPFSVVERLLAQCATLDLLDVGRVHGRLRIAPVQPVGAEELMNKTIHGNDGYEDANCNCVDDDDGDDEVDDDDDDDDGGDDDDADGDEQDEQEEDGGDVEDDERTTVALTNEPKKS